MISVLKRLIFFPELSEKKGIQNVSYFYCLIHCIHTILKFIPYRKISLAIYNMPGPVVSINLLTKQMSRDVWRGLLNLKFYKALQNEGKLEFGTISTLVSLHLKTNP